MPSLHLGDDMNSVIEFVGAGIVVPAAVSVATMWLSRQLLSAETSSRYSAAAAFAAAYGVGYLLLPSWAELVPKRHWHWTPYLALAAAVTGPISAANGLHLVERWLLYLMTAFVSAWLLVPTWASLQPPRSVCVPLLTGYLFLLAAMLEPLLSRLPAAAISAQLTISSACTAILVAGFISVTYAQTAGIVAAALTGCLLAASFSSGTTTARGLSLAYSVTVGGWAFIGCIEPQRPAFGLLLAPVAPLSLWWCVSGPVSRLHRRAAATVQTVMVLIHLAIAAGLMATTSLNP
ncbi:MAG: hypothetical protein HZA46_03790 [Planctomycetales bacterium]|nr:hypothetical protein [Planctomycetales bacterium]